MNPTDKRIFAIGDASQREYSAAPQDLDPETVRRIEDATRNIGDALNVLPRTRSGSSSVTPARYVRSYSCRRCPEWI